MTAGLNKKTYRNWYACQGKLTPAQRRRVRKRTNKRRGFVMGTYDECVVE